MNNEFTNITKQIIHGKSQTLGSELNHQLKQARLKSLENPHATQNIFFRAWFVPVAATTALALYFMMPLLNVETPSKIMQTEVYVDVTDMELIEQLELVENLEFYEWLSQEEEMSSI